MDPLSQGFIEIQFIIVTTNLSFFIKSRFSLIEVLDVLCNEANIKMNKL